MSSSAFLRCTQIIFIFFSLFFIQLGHLYAQTTPYLIQGLILYPKKNWQKIPTDSDRKLAHWVIPPPPVQQKPNLRKMTQSLYQEQQGLPSQNQDNTPLELTIYFFGESKKEDIAANIKAWQEKIDPLPSLIMNSDPPITQGKIGNLNTHQINLHGQYKLQPPYPSVPVINLNNYQLIGLIIEKPSGNLYLELIGPSASIERFKKTWNEFVRSIRIAKTPLQSPNQSNRNK